MVVDKIPKDWSAQAFKTGVSGLPDSRIKDPKRVTARRDGTTCLQNFAQLENTSEKTDVGSFFNLLRAPISHNIQIHI